LHVQLIEVNLSAALWKGALTPVQKLNQRVRIVQRVLRSKTRTLGPLGELGAL